MKFGVRKDFELALFRNRYLCAIGQNVQAVPSYDTLHSKWHPLPRMRHPKRMGATTLVHQDRLYVVGGGTTHNNNGLAIAVNHVEYLERSSSGFVWRKAAPLCTPRYKPSLVGMGGKIYAVGGKPSKSAIAMIKNVEVYDPTSNEWKEIDNAAPLHDRENFTMVPMLNEQAIVILGGTTPSSSDSGNDTAQQELVSAVEVFSVTHYKWGVFTTLPHARTDFVPIAVENTIYLFGGGTERIDQLIIDEPNLFKTHEGLSIFDDGNNIQDVPPTPTSSSSSSSRRRPSPTRTPCTAKLLPTYERLPEPPVRPLVPQCHTVRDRISGLTDWVTKVESLQRDFQDTIDSTMDQITKSYDARRDLEITLVRNKGKSWFEETQRLVDDAHHEINQKTLLLQQQQQQQQKAAASPTTTATDNPAEGSTNTTTTTTTMGSLLLLPMTTPMTIPVELCCPITLQLMKDPVMAADGNTYERAALERWFMNQPNDRPLSPLTGSVLSNKSYLPNHAIRSLCQPFHNNS